MISLKTKCCVQFHLNKILQSRKSIWSSKLSPPSFTWKFKLVFVLKKLLAWKEINCLGFWGKSYNLFVLKIHGGVTKELWPYINHLSGQKYCNNSVNHKHSGTEYFANIRCNDIRQDIQFIPVLFCSLKGTHTITLFHQTTKLWLFSFWWKLLLLLSKISQCNFVFL